MKKKMKKWENLLCQIYSTYTYVYFNSDESTFAAIEFVFVFIDNEGKRNCESKQRWAGMYTRKHTRPKILANWTDGWKWIFVEL